MNARHQRILDLLLAQREVSVAELAVQLKVSPITIRRDLELLEREGELTRTHGGAVFSRSAVFEFAFLDRVENRINEKAVIARYIADTVKPGMTIILDTGTTTLEVARAIAGIPRLRVLTSSLAIASALHPYDNIDLVLLGGSVRHHSPDLSGPLTEENLRMFKTDIVILGADAVSSDGVFTTDLDIARISRAMISSAQESWLVVDSSKFTRRSFVKFADWKNIANIVTDNGITTSDMAWLNESGCKLHIATFKTGKKAGVK